MAENRKVRYTKRVLRESLIELLQTRKLSDISVRALCEKSDINRTTFYSHYSDMDAFLDEIEDTMVAELPNTLEGDVPLQSFLRRQIAYTVENYSLIASLSERGKFFSKLNEKAISQWNRDNTKSSRQIEIFNTLSVFFTSGFYQTVIYWIDNGTDLSVEDLTLLIEGIYTAITDIRMKNE